MIQYKNIYIIGLLAVTVNCSSIIEEPNLSKSNSAQANPAALKCLADNYALEEIPQKERLLPELVCVNKQNQKRCKLWSYYHKKCHLE